MNNIRPWASRNRSGRCTGSARRTRVRIAGVALALTAGVIVLTSAPAAPAQAEPATAQAWPVPETGYVWHKVSTGCASAIAVGPNNIPWILGCGDPSKPREVYYLTYTGSGLVHTPMWQSAGLSGLTIAVDLNGFPYVTDTNGQLWSITDHSTLPGSFQWLQFTPGCVRSFAISATSTSPETELLNPGLFPIPGQSGHYLQPSVWGIGCNAPLAFPPADGWMYIDKFDWNTNWLNGVPETALPDVWARVGAWAGNQASQLAMFTNVYGPGPEDFTQNPWAIDASGYTYYLNSAYNQGPAFADSGGEPHFLPGRLPATSITDHFIQADRLFTFYWTGSIDGGGGTWEQLQIADDPGLTQIAFSSAIPGTGPNSNVTVGPSRLWGITSTGAVYEAVPQPGGTQ